MRKHLSSRVRLVLGLAAVSSIMFAIHCGTDGDGSFTEGGACQGLAAGACGKACTTDLDCAATLHCKADKTCGAECAQNTTCANGVKCSPRGRCGSDPTGGLLPPTSTNPDAGFDPGGGDSCADIDLKLAKTIPSVLFLVDRSGSMDDNNAWYPEGQTVTKRWDVIKSALLDEDGGVIKPLEGDVNFGLATYSWQSGTCPRIDSVGFKMGNHADIRDLLLPADTIDNTPTGESIRAVVGFNAAGVLNDAGFAAYDAGGGPKILILATDGDPDTCDAPNSNGSDPPRQLTLGATARTFDAGITTYVMAVGADGDDEHQQQVANVGQGRPATTTDDVQVFRPQNRQDMVSALRSIITGARSCKFTLNGSVVAGTEAQGQVTLNGSPVAYNDPNGWKLNGNKEIEFVGTTCNTIKTEPNAEVKVRFPCGTVVDIGVQ